MWLIVLIVFACLVALITIGYFILQYNIKMLNQIFESLNNVEYDDFEELMQHYDI